MEVFKYNIDFNMYKVFYAVAEYESFSKAANELCVSQPAVSYTIKKLEEELNVKLFTRFNKGILLTEEGKKLKTYVENALGSIIAGYKSIIESDEELTGEISIGVHSHVGGIVLPEIIKKFTSKYPNVKIFIFNSRSNEMKEMLKNGKLDIIILHYPIFTDVDKFREVKILSLESCFFGVKKYYDAFMLSKEGVSISEYPLLLPFKGVTTTNQLYKAFKKHNLMLSSNIYFYTTEMLVSFAKTGLGVGWALRDCIKRELEEGILYEIPINVELPKVEISLAYDKKNINKSALRLAEFMVEELTANNDLE